MESRSDRKQIKSAIRTVRIIEGLTELGELSVSELAEHIDLPPSTVYYYLDTLREEGYVHKNESTYQPGLTFLDIGEKVREQREIYEVARPKQFELANETGEMCNLMVEENGLGYHIARAEGENSIWTNPKVGDPGLLHSRALGKAILAHLSEDRVDEIVSDHGLPRETDHTITDRGELAEELEAIRERGVAFDDEERMIGVRCVAVPILNNNGQPLGSISVTGPKSRFRDDRFRDELPELLTDTANFIEINMNY